ncbi:MAG: thermonuclease family protein [Phycisphaerae bacterium]
MNRRRSIILASLMSLMLLSGAIQATEAGEIIAAKKGKVYHNHPRDCASARRIQAENRITFPSAKEAVRAGRRLCRRCQALDRKAAEGKDKPVRPDRSGDEKRTRPPGDARGERQSGPPPKRRERDTEIVLSEIVGVSKVLVGGTLELDNGEKAVLLGVICPDRGQPIAKEAARFLTDQVGERRLRISFDDTPGGSSRRDALGRLRVFATPVPGGRDVGAELIFQGYGWLDRAMRFSRRAEYLRHEESAWRDGRGIWKQFKTPADNPEVITGRHAWYYHRPNCRHARHMNGVMAMRLNEAKARRLAPCSEYRVRTKSH